MSVGIKICGLKDHENVAAALESGADWIGFVFYARSPRFVTPQEVGALLTRFGDSAVRRAVGLFVKPSDDEIAGALAAAPLSILQIYDSPERAAEIRQRFGLPVWVSIAVTTPSDLPDAPLCDGLVIEPAARTEDGRPGGNGRIMDWAPLKSWKAPQNWLLAGGLTPENVAEAITTSGAPAIDVSSGVETRPGVKSAELITRFVKAARTPCA
ncbi:N-(5'-phosphoribosyl)anthranilate isomerase [Acetobacteraceae bacterium EV16G]